MPSFPKIAIILVSYKHTYTTYFKPIEIISFLILIHLDAFIPQNCHISCLKAHVRMCDIINKYTYTTLPLMKRKFQIPFWKFKSLKKQKPMSPHFRVAKRTPLNLKQEIPFYSPISKIIYFSKVSYSYVTKDKAQQ